MNRRTFLEGPPLVIEQGSTQPGRTEDGPPPGWLDRVSAGRRFRSLVQTMQVLQIAADGMPLSGPLPSQAPVTPRRPPNDVRAR